MSPKILIEDVERMSVVLENADTESRMKLQPEYHDMVSRLRAHRITVPARCADLDAVLLEEAIEAQFDNMPV